MNKESTNVSQQEIYAYYSMNKQYVEGVQKWSNQSLLDEESKIIKRLYRSLAEFDTRLFWSNSGSKKGREWFLDYHVTPHEAPNRHYYFLKEIICIPTQQKNVIKELSYNVTWHHEIFIAFHTNSSTPEKI